MPKLQAKIGVIGGSGLYDIEGMADLEIVNVETPFGAPSDSIGIGRLGGAGITKKIKAFADIKNVIAPFPGGIARSGSKVGSQYSFLNASTNDPLYPTLRNKIEGSLLGEKDNCVYEVILDGANEEAIKTAMKLGILAAVQIPGVNKISAGNYGGKLGPYHFHLHKILGR